MFENTVVILNTRGRVDKQFTLSCLIDEILEHIIIVCYPGEFELLNEHWGHKVMGIIEHPNNLNNIGSIRQWCIDTFDNVSNIIFIDDNIKFSVRLNSEKGENCKFPLHQLIDKHFTQSTIKFVQLEMFKWIIDNLNTNEYGMVGISQRSGNNNELKDYNINSRIYAFWGVNLDLYNSIPQRKLSDVELKEDFYLTLHFLTNSIKTITSYKYAFDKCGGANSKGGCSTYRTIDKHNESSKILKQHFPNYVSIVEKNTKSWNGFDNKSLDVRINWKKAYNDSLKNNLK